MTISRNGYGGYSVGKFEVYSSYSETDITGTSVSGYCWCVKEDLDSDVIAFVSEYLEEVIEFCLDNN